MDLQSVKPILRVDENPYFFCKMLYARLRDPFGASKGSHSFHFHRGLKLIKSLNVVLHLTSITLSFNIREYVHGIALSFGFKSRGS